MMTRKSTSRTDKGRVILTERDWSGLRLVAEMRAMRLDHLGQFFAPGLEPATHQQDHAGSAASLPGEKRQRLPWPREYDKRLKNTYYIVKRWQKLGLARLEKPFAKAPMWCSITAAGLTQLGLPYDAAYPALGELEHMYQTTYVRLQLARAAASGNIPAHSWISERALAAIQEERRQTGIPAGHRPDGALQLHNGTLEAVEVELTRKSYQRLQAILEELTAPESDYARVRYFVSERVVGLLVEAHAGLDDERQQQVDIYRL